MKVRFEITWIKNSIFGIEKFHLLPVITLMWRDTYSLYIGWLVINLTITWGKPKEPLHFNKKCTTEQYEAFDTALKNTSITKPKFICEII